MRVLHVDYLRFLLPESFDGSLSQALRLVADHIEKDKPNILMENSFPFMEQEKAEEVWDCFNEVVNHEGHLCGVFAVNKWSERDKAWDYTLVTEGKVGK